MKVNQRCISTALGLRLVSQSVSQSVRQSVEQDVGKNCATSW